MESGLYGVKIKEHVPITARDGTVLSAALYMPVPREKGELFPAILEVSPYRKDDWRYLSDHRRMTYFAERGYVCCRLDVRGTGSSAGICIDEYSEEETLDGCDTIQWLVSRDWSNGNVGMFGISYSAFVAVQVAMRNPNGLKATVPIYATDDRYTDDVHYIGGCMTASELAQYALSQIAMNALPPKPEHVGDGWKEMWKERLEQTPAWLLTWMRNQRDSAYWRHGSLSPDYGAIRCALFSIGGWADGYTNAALRMHERCTSPRKTIIGPWVHSTPDSAYPGPNIDYLEEIAKFFDHWLKGRDNGVMDTPSLTFFRQEYTGPEPFPERVNGTWVSIRKMPSEATRAKTLYLGDGTLGESIPSPGKDRYEHRPTLGTRAGLCWGAGERPNGLARDLRPEEALSLAYTGEPLDKAVDILGFPETLLHLSSDAPVSHLVVRLSDVPPDGTSALVSTGILNLTHRHSHENPEPLEPGEVYKVGVQLKGCGYRFLPGHRMRLSVASAYWPVIWPSPYKGENTLHRGEGKPSRLILPVLGEADGTVPELKTTPPRLKDIGKSLNDPAEWSVTENVMEGSVTVAMADGDTSVLPDGTSIHAAERIVMTAYHNMPSGARLQSDVLYELASKETETRVGARICIGAGESAFDVEIELDVQLDGEQFFEKTWKETIGRDLL